MLQCKFNKGGIHRGYPHLRGGKENSLCSTPKAVGQSVQAVSGRNTCSQRRRGGKICPFERRHLGILSTLYLQQYV